MAHSQNGVIYCTADELWAIAPEREDFAYFGGADAVSVWPKSRSVICGGTKYPALTADEFQALSGLINQA